jgi:HK97 family phage prohead protease
MRALEFFKPLEIKFAADTGEITGYGATFGNVDSQGDICAAGCFSKSLGEHKAAGTIPAMLWAHDTGEPIGVWHEMGEDKNGLFVRGKITMETRRGAEARALAKDGALAHSIGFQTRDAKYDAGHRILTDVKLWEVSLVSIPANTQARLITVKSAAQAAEEIRDAIAFERFLKASGFANSLARRLAAGWNDAVGRREDDEALEQFAALLKQSARRFETKGTDQ